MVKNFGSFLIFFCFFIIVGLKILSFKDTKLQCIPSRFELVAEYVRVFEPLIMTNVVLNFTVFGKSQQKQ